MSYQLTKTNGQTLLELNNEIIDYETISNIGLIGKLTPNYGETQSNNFIRIIENFSNTEFPTNPILGMLCYRSDRQGLYICINENTQLVDESECWLKLPSVSFSSTEPSVSISNKGDIWFNDIEKKLYIYDDELRKWICIGPDDYLNKNTISNIGSSNNADYSYVIDFNSMKDSNDTSYLITAKIIGREYNVESNNNETASYIVKCMVNSNESVLNNETVATRYIVGNPNIETIAVTNGVAQNWGISFSINEDNNLVITAKGQPTIINTNNKVDWLFNIEVLKLFNKG